MSFQDLKVRSGQYVHECSLVWCRTCKEYHKEGATDECFMKPPPTPKNTRDTTDLEKEAAELLDSQDWDLVRLLSERQMEEEVVGDHPMDTVRTIVWPFVVQSK